MIFNLERFFFQHLNLIPFLRGIAVKFPAREIDVLAEIENCQALKVPVDFQNRNSKNYYLNQY